MNLTISLLSGRTRVRSSNLHSVGYDPFSGVLEIAFRNGRFYEYYGVPYAIYHGLMRAHSHGQYFHIYIRNAYPFQRIE